MPPRFPDQNRWKTHRRVWAVFSVGVALVIILATAIAFAVSEIMGMINAAIG